MNNHNISEDQSPRSFKWLITSMLLLQCLLVWWHERTIHSPVQVGQQGANQNKRLPQSKISQQPVVRAVPIISYWDKLKASLMALPTNSNSQQNEQAIAAWADAVSAAEISSALQFLEEQDQTDLIQSLETRLIRRWARTDAAAAAAWAEQMSPGPAQQKTLNGVAIVWADQDLTAATAWARDLPEVSDQQSTLSTIAYEAARNAPKSALELASSLPDTPGRDDLVCYATSQWAVQDPESAAQWAGQIEASDLKDKVLAAIATQWAETDPAAATELAVQSLPPGKLQDDAVVGIVERLAEQDPQQTASWVAQFPAGNLRTDAVDNLISLWTAQDWQAPAQWLEELPAGSLRDTALVAFARRVAPYSRSTAQAWIGQIGDAVVRAQAAAQLGN